MVHTVTLHTGDLRNFVSTALPIQLLNVPGMTFLTALIGLVGTHLARVQYLAGVTTFGVLRQSHDTPGN